MRAYRSTSRGQRAISFVAALGLGLLVAASASAQCLEPPGDLNKDGVTNVLDLQCAIFVSLAEVGGGALPDCLKVPAQAADVNCDNETNISDVLLLVMYAVNLPLSPVIDSNGSGCPDACEVPAVYAPLPTIATGMSASPSWTLKATASGFQAKGTSSSQSFTLRPKAVISQD